MLYLRYITLFGDRNIFNTRKLSRKLTKLTFYDVFAGSSCHKFRGFSKDSERLNLFLILLVVGWKRNLSSRPFVLWIQNFQYPILILSDLSFPSPKPSPRTASSLAFSVRAFRWRITYGVRSGTKSILRFRGLGNTSSLLKLFFESLSVVFVEVSGQEERRLWVNTS